MRIRRSLFTAVLVGVSLLATGPVRASIKVTQVTWAHKHAGVEAGYPGPGIGGPISDPQGDIQSVKIYYDTHYMHFIAKLTQASTSPPVGTTEMDFVWRFTIGGKLYFVVGAQAVHSGLAFSALAGQTTGSPSPPFAATIGGDNAQPCTTCFAQVDPTANTVSFVASLADINSTLSSADPTAPAVKKGTVFSALEFDTFVDIAPALFNNMVEQFQTDAAPAPKGLTYTV